MIEELGKYLQERFMYLFPDFNFYYQTEVTQWEKFLRIKIAKCHYQDQWVEIHNNIELSHYSFNAILSVASYLMTDDFNFLSYKEYVFEKVLAQWVEHRLKEKGL